MRRLTSIILTVVLLAAPALSGESPGEGRVVIENRSAYRMNLRFDLRGIESGRIYNGTGSRTASNLEGGDAVREPGRPCPPATGCFIIVPPGMRVEAWVSEDLPRHRIADAPPEWIEPTLASRLKGVYPPRSVEVGVPLRMRHLRMAQVTAYPVQYDPARRCYIERERLGVEIRFVPDDRVRMDERPFDRTPSPQFQRLVESLAVNPPPHRDDRELIEARGYDEYYLFVLPEAIEEDVRRYALPLIYRMVEWKRCAGNKVDILFIPEGDERDADAIREHIQDYYDDLLERGVEPFDCVLLIGEEELHPHNNNQGGQGMDIILLSPEGPTEIHPWLGHWDLNYALLEGDDLIPDVALSRFHAGALSMLANGVNKTLSYESEPSLKDPSWFNQAALVEEAILGGGASVGPTVDYVQQVLERNRIEVIAAHREGVERIPGAWVGEQFSRGIGFFGGRAVNENITYHSGATPQDYFDAVGAFPVAILASGHGEYAMESLFWVGREYYDRPERYNDLSGAKGAVVSTGVWENPSTIPNNAICMGMTHAMFNLDLSFGWARNWTLMNLARTFPGDDTLLIQYSDDFQLCGETGLRAWKGVPRVIAVDCPTWVPSGANFIPVRVFDPMGGEGVPDVLVTLYAGGIEEVGVFKVGFTDDDGCVDFVFDEDLERTILVAATGDGLYPAKGTVEVGEADLFVRAEIDRIDDDEGGNGDGMVNPGERLLLTFTAANTGRRVAAHRVRVIVRSDSWYADLEPRVISFGDIEPCLLYTSPSPRDLSTSRMPSSA